MLLVLGLVASAAGAANLVDVRVGVHKKYTRVVLETDGRAGHQVSEGDREFTVHLDASGKSEAITAKSPHLIWVKVEPAARGGSDVRIQLRGPSRLETLVLRKPDRIVLDVYPAPEKAKAAPPPPVAPPAPSPKPAQAQAPVAPAPEAAPSPTPAPGMAPAPPEPPPAVAGAEPGAASEAADSLTVEVLRPQPAPSPPAERPVTPQPLPQPAAAPPAGPLDFLPPPLNQPTTLGLLAAIFVALFILLRLRRRRAQLEEDLSPFDRDEDSDEAEVVAESEGGVSSIFDAAAPAEEAPAAVEVPPVAPAEPAPAATPAAPSGPVGEAPAGELERRLAHMEKRLEEMADARERLERQVAAQTEELRVQRAAIARTQRVVRSISAGGEEEATEPAPKT